MGRLLVASERPIFLSTGEVGMAERALAGHGASLGAWRRGTGRRRPDPRYPSVYTREATGCIVAWKREAKMDNWILSGERDRLRHSLSRDQSAGRVSEVALN